MFNQNTAEVEKSSSPELININESFAKANAEYLEILYNVEDKLHNILNLRTPEKGIDSPADKSINDFVGSIHENIKTLRNQNARLQKVYDHIKRII